MPAALERAELVDILARRDVAQRVGLADHAWRVAVEEKYGLDEHIAQAALEEHGGERRGRDLLQRLAAIR